MTPRSAVRAGVPAAVVVVLGAVATVMAYRAMSDAAELRMVQSSMDEIIRAMIFRWLAPVAVGVALAAFFVRSRLVFALGMLGLLLGFVVPERVVYAEYSSGEGAYLAAVYDRVTHIVVLSVTGAVGGTLCGTFVVRAHRRRRKACDTDPSGETNAEAKS